MKYILLLLFVPLYSYAQNLRVTVDTLNPKRPFVNKTISTFDYLHPDFDARLYSWIGDITFRFDNFEKFDHSFEFIESTGKRYGANAFRVTGADIRSEDKFIKISLFKIRNRKEKRNLDLYKQNKVYLIGFPFTNHYFNTIVRALPEQYIFKFGSERIEIQTYNYVLKSVPQDQKVKIKLKNGQIFSRISMTIKGYKNNPNLYLSPAHNPFKNNFIPAQFININTISDLRAAKGEYLLQILKFSTV